MLEAAVALGSNLADPAAQVRRATRELAQLPRTRLNARSSLYRTAPVGPLGQPDYCNAVAMLETELTADSLLTRLQGIEQRHGRRRGQRWGARTLDLDLLTYAGEIRRDARLTLPHPRIAERAFVLVPWNEIAPWLQVPGLDTVGAMAGGIDRRGVEPWDHE